MIHYPNLLTYYDIIITNLRVFYFYLFAIEQNKISYILLKALIREVANCGCQNDKAFNLMLYHRMQVTDMKERNLVFKEQR